MYGDSHMNISNIIDYVLKNAPAYPGKHNNSTERTGASQKPLEPKAQMLIIWKAMIQYLDNNLRAGRSVHIRNFGAFTFDIQTDLPNIASRQIDRDTDLQSTRMARKHLHHLRPCFVPDSNF